MGIKDDIRNEMTTDVEDVLEKYFDQVKNLVELNENGKVFVKAESDFSAKEEILAYLIGKHYAVKAEYTDTPVAENQELIQQLERPKGTVEWGISELKQEKKISSTGKGKHKIPVNVIGKALEELR